MLFWTGLCFVFLSINNVVLFIDTIVLPTQSGSAHLALRCRARGHCMPALRLHLGIGMMEIVVAYLSWRRDAGILVAGRLFFLRILAQDTRPFVFGFGVAFVLLSINQILATVIGAGDENVVYAYLLRVLGFILHSRRHCRQEPVDAPLAEVSARR